MTENEYHHMARVALAFVLEDEHWNTFTRWCMEMPHSTELHDWLDAHTVQDARLMWMENKAHD